MLGKVEANKMSWQLLRPRTDSWPSKRRGEVPPSWSIRPRRRGRCARGQPEVERASLDREEPPPPPPQPAHREERPPRLPRALETVQGGAGAAAGRAVGAAPGCPGPEGVPGAGRKEPPRLTHTPPAGDVYTRSSMRCPNMPVGRAYNMTIRAR